MTLKVTIDGDLCEGHAQCVMAAPNVFTIDDDDEQAQVLTAEPVDEMRHEVERAKALCPTRAISVER